MFGGGDNDLILVPVDAMYALLLAGSGVANPETVIETVNAMLAVRDEVGRSLRSMGVTAELKEPATQPAQKKRGKTGELRSAAAAPAQALPRSRCEPGCASHRRFFSATLR